jgi:AcrR family transcriptional regulator
MLENPCQYTDTIVSELSMPEKRNYDSPARREQAAATRERIVAAGAELVHELTTWDWSQLTFRAVANRAGVSERTVYRNFSTERLLHDAVMARLEDAAGINYAAVELDTVADVTGRVFASLHRFAAEGSFSVPSGRSVPGANERRQAALMRAVTERAPHLTDSQRKTAAGLLDVLWNPPSYERLVREWKLDDGTAIGAVQWLIGKIVEAVDANEIPE